MDKAIVRITTIIFNIYLLITLCNAWQGCALGNYDMIFGYSAMTGLILSVLSFSQGSYHCKWMRSLALNILFTQVFTFVVSEYTAIEDFTYCLVILSVSWGVSTILVFYFAISHFVKVQKLKKKKLKQYSQINGNLDARSESED